MSIETTNIALKCQCGNVKGSAQNVSARRGIRMICYCKHCQNFARFLNNEESILDEFGGTEVFMMPPSQITFSQGQEYLRCTKLTSKGPYRIYTDCCKTPVGNTFSAALPFLTVIHNIFDCDKTETQMGHVKAYINTKGVKNNLPKERLQKGLSPFIIGNFSSKLLLWKLKGMNKPTPFFNTNGELSVTFVKPTRLNQ